MKVFKYTSFVIIVFVFGTSVFATLMGHGEVTGEVVESWLSGDNVVFNLKISNQNNERGPVLGNPNKFAYSGPDKMEVTAGDVVKLRYNSDDGYGIHVDSIEFIQNKPGTVSQNHTAVWILAPVVVIALAALLIVLLIRKRRLAPPIRLS